MVPEGSHGGLAGRRVAEIYIDGSFCTEKPGPGDVDGYWVEPDAGVYDRLDPYWIDFEPILVPRVRKWKWRMWAGHGLAFFIHPAMQARPDVGVQVAGFRRALAKADEEMAGKRSAAVRGSYEGMIRQLEDELREYDQLKSGELSLPPVERLDQAAPFIVKIRIARGLSQTELAHRLGVSKQVISRYEESEYQTVAIGRLQEILEAIGVKTAVTLSA
ncbi:MAG: helix-turn-helix domain-containing protein [Candidatus Solibacter usitatus]|nr:helix-turn-helix domain-containing protein [Candidatus Solibacter usitatus]